ncbi:peptidoglycan-binding domain-containing protein [Loktanella sp. SALINAS62]|uniref:peptidoglycan-binding domain-containing protein n=1 Tax=Loktanella sp. SALINAS62 TaxID=2706124 RepID=UPI001B8BB0D1|nr:peptidoglycan-binding domain-containing protein [Loktanella sp. SALINAS62]MBS1303908.1 peptidoglycan-binding protein [Loktanella sp. SALINAS62]
MYRILPVLAVLAACAVPASSPDPFTDSDVISMGEIQTDTLGRCFARTEPRTRVDVVERLEQVAPERRDAIGNVTDPPVFRTVMEPRSVVVGPGTRFQAVCPPALTEPFVQSLQRALLIRRLYNGPISGLYDADTRAAVQQFQRDRGTDSAVLSVVSAQDLGIFAVARN